MAVALKVCIKQQPLGITDLFNNYKKAEYKKINAWHYIVLSHFKSCVRVQFKSEKYVITDIYMNVLKLLHFLEPCLVLCRLTSCKFICIHLRSTIVCTLYLNKKFILKDNFPHVSQQVYQSDYTQELNSLSISIFTAQMI